MYKITVLEDGYEAVNKSLESLEDLKSAIIALDTYGVGGYSTPFGVEFGTPTWTYKKSLKALLESSENWAQLSEGLVEAFGELARATPKGVTIKSDVGLDEEWITMIHEEG